MASLMDILKSVGFKGEALKMAYAIAMAESSGNARAHNPNRATGDNSYGLFQINMLGAMGPERRKRFGLKSNEDLFDPYVNARIAYRMSNGGKNWTPWSTYNRGDYRKYYGGSGQQVAYSGGSGGGGGGTSKDRQQLAEEYGFTEAIFNAVPELKTLFRKAVDGGWSASKFQAELRDTKWFKSKPETARKFLIEQYSDPATSKQKIDQQQIKMAQMAKQLGVSGWILAGKHMRNFAIQALMNGWDDSRIRYELGRRTVFSGERVGELGEITDKLAEYAYSMGQQVSEGNLQGVAKRIIQGVMTEQDYQDQLRRNAKTMFPQWQKQLDSGQTVADLASPYFQSMAQILELPPGSINLFDPTIKKSLQYKDPQTGANAVKPLWQFENELRSDSRWKSTKNAQDSLMQVAHQVLADFGLKY